jgi:CHAT domain-containing protein
MYTAAAQSQTTGQLDRNWEIVAFGTTQTQRGFSALPGVRQELASIVGQGGLSGEVNLDEQFTAAQMRTSLTKGSAVLHLASHFKFSPGTEVDSFLLLGDGNALTLQQLRGDDYHFQKLDLLTLSACETAMQGGRDSNGREIEGMGALAQNKGAKAVLATLWSISDASTPKLMQKFYTGKKSSHLTTVEALRLAQIELLKGTTKPQTIKSENPSDSRGAKRTISLVSGEKKFVTDPNAPYSHPYFWAPFILIGNLM